MTPQRALHGFKERKNILPHLVLYTMSFQFPGRVGYTAAPYSHDRLTAVKGENRLQEDGARKVLNSYNCMNERADTIHAKIGAEIGSSWTSSGFPATAT